MSKDGFSNFKFFDCVQLDPQGGVADVEVGVVTTSSPKGVPKPAGASSCLKKPNPTPLSLSILDENHLIGMSVIGMSTGSLGVCGSGSGLFRSVIS